LKDKIENYFICYAYMIQKTHNSV